MAPPANPRDHPACRAAEPRYHGRVLDSWNAVAAGHQRPEYKGPAGWRDSRNRKLGIQYAGGHGGGPRLSDTVGAGAEDYDDARRVLTPRHGRAQASNSVVDMVRKQAASAPRGARGRTLPCSETKGAEERSTEEHSQSRRCSPAVPGRRPDPTANPQNTRLADVRDPIEGGNEDKRRIFDGTVVYVNGSTYPAISDHKLKRVLVENGARVSLHLGRRQVTHVVVGRPAGPSLGSGVGGAGGGLAGGKLEKEIRRLGNSVKYVGVEWVLESIKAGKRLPEARFANLKLASRGQQSVYSNFAKAAASPVRS
ncbi:hypothetical protein VTK73DRAFT_5494 [Phialemonium thermophilum]|uniref:BRCT domain-containing protein n=1 Tax=Phialemonium thermophilum TaxID=223376 RepID=A0ABR3WNJ6_9PEZI